MRLAGSGCLGWKCLEMHIQNPISLRSGLTEEGGRWGVPPSLPGSACFFYESLEIVMKDRLWGEMQLFAQSTIQRPGFCCVVGGFWRNIVCNAKREQLKITKASSCHIAVLDYLVLWSVSYNPYLQEINLVLRYDNFSGAIPSRYLSLFSY